VLEKYEAQIKLERYNFNSGKVLADVRRDLKWADGSAIKKEVDLRVRFDFC